MSELSLPQIDNLLKAPPETLRQRERRESKNRGRLWAPKRIVATGRSPIVRRRPAFIHDPPMTVRISSSRRERKRELREEHGKATKMWNSKPKELQGLTRQQQRRLMEEARLKQPVEESQNRRFMRQEKEQREKLAEDERKRKMELVALQKANKKHPIPGLRGSRRSSVVETLGLSPKPQLSPKPPPGEPLSLRQLARQKRAKENQQPWKPDKGGMTPKASPRSGARPIFKGARNPSFHQAPTIHRIRPEREERIKPWLTNSKPKATERANNRAAKRRARDNIDWKAAGIPESP